MTFESSFVILKSFSETIDITLYYKQNMMVGSKGILTPLIPNCYVLCTPAILKTFVIRSFFSKMAPYSCFWRVPSSKILLQASLRQISDLLTLISEYLYKTSFTDRKEAYNCYGSHKKASGTGKDTFRACRI